jgi:hypothetical protein
VVAEEAAPPARKRKAAAAAAPAPAEAAEARPARGGAAKQPRLA